MAFCKKCGKEVDEGIKICNNCKLKLNPPTNTFFNNLKWCILSFLFPIIGLTIFLCLDNDDSDGKVANCGMFSMIGIGFRVLIYVILSMKNINIVESLLFTK